MDGSHPADQPVPNRHVVTLDWWRTELDVKRALTDEISLGLYVPYDVKDQRARFETTGGGSFSNPQGEIHHRTERLEGVGDLELTGDLFVEDLRLTLGFSLPTGRIEDDPYELGALGLRHRHIQFGTGTVDPIVRASASVPVDFLDFDISAGVRAPLYENRKGYRGSTVLDFTVGPRVSITDGLGASVHYIAQYQTRAYWDGEPDENAGYFLQGIGFSVPIELARGVVLRPSALYILDIDVRSGADNFEMEWLLGLSLEFAFGGGDEPDAASRIPEERGEP